MEIVYDHAKNAINVAKHRIALDLASDLFEGPVITRIDARKDYGEARFIALGEITGRVHVCVYAVGDGLRRVISLRKANRRETNAYRKSYP